MRYEGYEYQPIINLHNSKVITEEVLRSFRKIPPGLVKFLAINYPDCLMVGSTIRELWLFALHPDSYNRTGFLSRALLLRASPEQDIDVVMPTTKLAKLHPTTPSCTDNGICYFKTSFSGKPVDIIGLPPLDDPGCQHIDPIVHWCLQTAFPADAICAHPHPDGSLTLHTPIDIMELPLMSPLPFPHAIDRSHSEHRILRTLTKTCFTASRIGSTNKLQDLPDVDQYIDFTPEQAASLLMLALKLVNTPSMQDEDAYASLALAQHGLLQSLTLAAVVASEQPQHDLVDQAIKAIAYLVWTLFKYGGDETPWWAAERICPDPNSPQSVIIAKLDRFSQTDRKLWEHPLYRIIDPSRKRENTDYAQRILYRRD